MIKPNNIDRLYQKFLNSWIDCRGGNPNLPRDTIVSLYHEGGHITDTISSRKVDWRRGLRQYTVLKYRIVKV